MGPVRGYQWPGAPRREVERPPAVGVRWGMHWDPHPVCWLHNTLSHAPYAHRGLGMRTCRAGGIAITVPEHEVVIGVGPVDRWRVTWSVHTHHPSNDYHRPDEFGQFTWIALDRDAVDWATSTMVLADGSKLTVAAHPGLGADNRLRIESRAVPSRVVSGTNTWADLAAVEHTAARVHAWLTQQG